MDSVLHEASEPFPKVNTIHATEGIHVCDFCGRWQYGSPPRLEAQRWLDAGWHVFATGKSKCPVCVKEKQVVDFPSPRPTWIQIQATLGQKPTLFTVKNFEMRDGGIAFETMGGAKVFTTQPFTLVESFEIYEGEKWPEGTGK